MASLSGETETLPIPQELATSSPWNKKSWGTSPPVVPCNLQDVMSEQLASQLQHDEEIILEGESNCAADSWPISEELDTSNDLLLAQMLQLQYDKEHDAVLTKEEMHVNKQSKVQISFSNYRSVHPALLDGESEDSEDSQDEVDEDTVRQRPNFKNGIVGKGKNITTKHDATLCGRRNARRVMENFPPEIDTGDDTGVDMQLSNQVYNSLKAHSVAESKRRARLHEKKEHATAQQAVDPKTRLAMYKLVNSGILENINGIVSTGKESVVFHATGGFVEGRTIPTECAMKVFKTTLNEFKTREKYIRGDYRFAKDEFKIKNPRRIIRIWAEKEMINLKKMRRNGIPCPEVVILKNHILVMSFIGHDQVPAPQLKEVTLSPIQAQNAYIQCVQAMRNLYKECSLVHADLSEYNMLWHNRCVHLIDVSQAVDLSHPHAHEFLLRDCTNVALFFNKLNVPEAMNQYELFNDITGLNLKGEGQEFLSQIQEYEKEELYVTRGQQRKEYAFDHFFDKTKSPSKVVEDSDSNGEN